MNIGCFTKTQFFPAEQIKEYSPNPLEYIFPSYAALLCCHYPPCFPLLPVSTLARLFFIWPKNECQVCHNSKKTYLVHTCILEWIKMLWNSILSLKFCFNGQGTGSHKDWGDSEALIMHILISMGLGFHSRKELFGNHSPNGRNTWSSPAAEYKICSSSINITLSWGPIAVCFIKFWTFSTENPKQHVLRFHGFSAISVFRLQLF